MRKPMSKWISVGVLGLFFSSSLAFADTVERRLLYLEESVRELQHSMKIQEVDGVVVSGATEYKVTADCEKITPKQGSTFVRDLRITVRKEIKCGSTAYYLVDFSDYTAPVGMVRASDTILFD